MILGVISGFEIVFAVAVLVTVLVVGVVAGSAAKPAAIAGMAAAFVVLGFASFSDIPTPQKFVEIMTSGQSR